EGPGEFAIRPSRAGFQCLRQVPMIKRGKRADAGGEQSVYQAFVVIQAFLVRLARAGRLDARPGNGEAIALEIHGAQQRNVFRIAMIGIASDVAGVSAFYFADGVREAVPDGFALAVNVPCSLDLIGGSGRTPEKIFWELERRCRLGG